MGGRVVSVARQRALAVLEGLAAWALVAACAWAADAGVPGSHSSPGGVAPSRHASVHSFKCGDGFCDSRRHYCETIKTDVPSLPSDHACMPLPPACKAAASAPSCGCFAEGTRCDFCSVVDRPGGGTAYMRTCIGGR